MWAGTESLLAYAVDILVLTASRDKIRQIISKIEVFFGENGLSLNKGRSASLEFVARHGKPYIKANGIAELPIVSKYKYIGLWLNNKLTIDD